MAKGAARNENLTYEDLLQIVELLKSSPQFSEFHLKAGDMEVNLRRRTNAHAATVPGESQEPPRPARQDAPTGFPEGTAVVRSPMVGTFYRAPGPGAPPFVEVGQRVEPETTVCIIEVMKLMSSIPAGAKGVVREILVGDAEPVEYGQPLIVILPD